MAPLTLRFSLSGWEKGDSVRRLIAEHFALCLRDILRVRMESVDSLCPIRFTGKAGPSYHFSFSKGRF